MILGKFLYLKTALLEQRFWILRKNLGLINFGRPSRSLKCRWRFSALVNVVIGLKGGPMKYWTGLKEKTTEVDLWNYYATICFFFWTGTKSLSDRIVRLPDLLDTSALAYFEGLLMAFMFFTKVSAMIFHVVL